MTDVDCEKVRGSAKDYWEVRNSELRALQFHWLEIHIEKCQACSEFVEDVVEKMNLKPPGAEMESC